MAGGGGAGGAAVAGGLVAPFSSALFGEEGGGVWSTFFLGTFFLPAMSTVFDGRVYG
jgi:hypothetical protein